MAIGAPVAYAVGAVLSSVRAWIQASRPLAQVNIAVPLLVGEALAPGPLDLVLLAWLHLFGVLDQLFIVYANDVADEAGDRENRTFTIFSGGSRVLVEGKLDAASLRRGAMLMATAMLAVCAYLALARGRLAMLPGWGAAVGLLWAYSYPPLRAAYRGGGEAVQGLGVGVVLPLMGFYVQSGSLTGFPWPALFPLFLLGWASNVTTALPDVDADASVDKRTYAVRVGGLTARRHSLQVIAIAILLTPLVLPGATPAILLAVEAPAVAVLGISVLNLRKAEPVARGPMRWFILGNGGATNLIMIGWIVVRLLGAS